MIYREAVCKLKVITILSLYWNLYAYV